MFEPCERDGMMEVSLYDVAASDAQNVSLDVETPTLCTNMYLPQ